jgi:hypothetical protein
MMAANVLRSDYVDLYRRTAGYAGESGHQITFGFSIGGEDHESIFFEESFRFLFRQSKIGNLNSKIELEVDIGLSQHW